MTAKPSESRKARFLFHGEWNELDIAFICDHSSSLKPEWHFICGESFTEETRFRAFKEGWRYALANPTMTGLLSLCVEVENTGKVAVDLDFPCITGAR